VVCEGYATGASIHEATGIAVAVSFNAGNLEAVALSIKTRYPEATVILAADDDHAKQLNVGLRKATEAALTVGGLLAIPYFNTDRNSEWTDFNDLHTHEGLEAVKRCFSVVSLTDPSKVWPMRLEVDDNEVRICHGRLFPKYATKCWEHFNQLAQPFAVKLTGINEH